MKSKYTVEKNLTTKTVVDTLRMKKEIKLRVQNGENLRTVTEEKGLKVVLPL